MSVIFQLFCAEDLKRLTKPQLAGLSDIIGAALRRHTNTPNRPAPLKLSLNVSDTVSPPPQTPAKVQEALKKRFREVSHQLEAPQLQPSLPGFDFGDLRDARRSPDKREQEELIIQWAITCEIENYAFYLPILLAKREAYDYFDREVKINMAREGQKPLDDKIVPIGPDSPYSPLNRRHPLYALYYDLDL